MSRDTYDVQEPGTPDDLPSDGPACPRCGGGPVTPIRHLERTLLVCQSCAAVVRVAP